MEPNERLEKLKRLQSLREQQLLRQNPAGNNEASALPDTAFGQALQNAPGSAKQLISDVTAPIHSPIETAKGVAQAVMNPGQVMEALGDRYGSPQAVKDTLIQDPMGAISDILGIVTGGTSAAARVPGASKVPESIMESTVKFPTSVKMKDRKRNIKVMLAERITPDQKGLDKLDKIVTGINNEIDGIIANAELSGATIAAADVRAPLNDLIRKRRDSIGPDKETDIAQLNKIRTEFNKSLEGRTDLNPQEVQSLKKDLYERLNFDARTGTGTEVSQRGRKALSRGARGGVANLDPRIDALNQRQGPLLDMSPDLEKAANRIDNRNNIGSMGAGLGAGAGATVGGAIGLPIPGAILGGIAGKAATSPKVAQNAAIMMQRLIDAGQSPASAMIIVQQAMTQAGRTREQQQ